MQNGKCLLLLKLAVRFAMHLKHARITSLHMHVAFLKIFFLFYKGDSDLNEIFI